MKIHINARTGLGDSVYFFSILQTLAGFFEETSISLFCWNAGAELYRAIPIVTKIINANDLVTMFDKTMYKKNSKGKNIFDEEIGPVDYYIDLQPCERYMIEAKSVQAATKIAVNPEPSCEELYDVCIRTDDGEHILDTYRRMLTTVFSITQFAVPGSLPVSDEMKHKIEKIMTLVQRGADRPVVCIHPGGKDLFKLWDVRRWGTLVNWLIDVYNFLPVIIGSSLRFAGQLPILDIPSAEAIQRLSYDRSFNFAGNTDSMDLLINLIQQSDLYIGLDAGPTHIAAVSGIPTVELFKVQTPHQLTTWRTQGDHVLVVPADSMDELSASSVIDDISNWKFFTNRFSRLKDQG